MGESEHRATGDRAEAEDRAKDDPGGDHRGTADEPREGEEPERQQEARDTDAQVETLEPDQG